MKKIKVEIIETVTRSTSQQRTGSVTIHLPEHVQLDSNQMSAYVQELYHAGEVSVRNWSPYRTVDSDSEEVTIETGQEEDL